MRKLFIRWIERKKYKKNKKLTKRIAKSKDEDEIRVLKKIRKTTNQLHNQMKEYVNVSFDIMRRDWENK